jgi:ParB/RepB/Spo0J family partition protein
MSENKPTNSEAAAGKWLLQQMKLTAGSKAEETPSRSGFLWVKIEDLAEWTEQPRTHFDPALIESLAGLMATRGFDDAFPILVRETVSGVKPYEIADGHRRWRSAKRAGIGLVPIIVRTLTDEQMLEIAMISGLQHESLSPLEEALGYRRMLRGGRHTVASIASAIGRAESTVKNKLLLCKIAGTPVADALEADTITWSHAVRIARHPSEAARLQLLGMVVKPAYGPGPMPVAELERQLARDWVKELRGCGWSLDDETLVPEVRDGDGDRVHGGACKECPFNSLFADGDGKSKQAMCMNLACYRAKETATHERWVAEEAAKGNVALGAEENKQVWNQDGTGLAYNSPYVLADAKPSVAEIGAKPDAELKTWGKLVDGAEVPVVLAVDAKGKVRTLIKREVAVEAVKVVDAEMPAAQKILAEPKKVKKTDATAEAEAKDKAAAEAVEKRLERAEVAAIVTAARLPIAKLTEEWLGMALTVLAYRVAEAEVGAVGAICVRRGWASDDEGAVTDLLDLLLEKGGELPAHEQVSLLTELLIFATPDLPGFIGDWAAAVGVDLKKVRKETVAAMKAEAKAEADKAAVCKGVRWITKRKHEVADFKWKDSLCTNADCAVVEIGKGMIAHLYIARVEKGWVYGFSLEIAGVVHGEKVSAVVAKYGTPELAVVSALTALRMAVERNAGTDEQLAKLTDYIKAAQKGAK